MTCQIHFYHLNDHFSQEYADEHNDGSPSELNRMYLWEDEFEIKTNVTKVDTLRSGTYALQGKSGDADFTEEIDEMCLFYLMDGETPVAVVGCWW